MIYVLCIAVSPELLFSGLMASNRSRRLTSVDSFDPAANATRNVTSEGTKEAVIAHAMCP